jgi:hypothetical protein
MTAKTIGNCGAGASEAKPEKPKMRLRFVAKPIFTLFSVAVLFVSVALIAGFPPAAAINSSNAISNTEASKMSKNSLSFHDGQNYRVMMNYYYTRIVDRYQVWDPDFGWVWKTITQKDDVRGYDKKQTTRTFSNGNFNMKINSALTNGYPPSNTKHYGEILNNVPDYWTAMKGTIYGSTIGTGYVDLSGFWSTFMWKGASISQDVYVVNNKAISSYGVGTKFTLSFFARGLVDTNGKYPQAILRWYLGDTPKSDPITFDVSSTTWLTNPYNFETTRPSQADHIQITFQARGDGTAYYGGYLYISDTSFWL